MSKPIAIGLVGAGFVANIHARSYRRLRDLGVSIGAVTAVPVEQAMVFAREYGIKVVCEDFKSLLDRPGIDIVDICVPNSLHAPFSIAAAQAGKHIICEKPLTGYFGGEGAADPVGDTPKSVMLAEVVRTAEAMITVAESNGVKLMYAENWLYSPPVQKALRLARASGGTILEIRAQECHSGSHAGYSKEWQYAGGGALIRVGPHPLGTAIYAKQQEGLQRDGKPINVRSVLAETGDLSQVRSVEAEEKKWLVGVWKDVENWSTVILTFEDGTHAIIFASDTVLGGMEDTLEIFLSNARVACDMTHSTMMQAYAPDPSIFANEYLAEKLETKAGWSYPAFDEEWLLGYPQELRDFVEAVREDRSPMVDGRLGLDVIRVIYAAYQSAEEGRRVDL